MESATAIEKELDSITLGYSDGSKKKITGFKLGEVEDVKDATTAATSGEIGSDNSKNAANPTGAANPAGADNHVDSISDGKIKGGKKSRKPKSKRIRIRKTRRRKH